MEIEVILERVIRWLDALLSDPQGQQTVENLLTAVDQWLQNDLATKANQPPPAAPQSAPVSYPTSDQSSSPNSETFSQRPQPLPPRSLRGKQSSTTGMIE